MKPKVFKNEGDLIVFMNNLPVSGKSVKIPGMFDGESVQCSQIVNELKTLAPRMFELRTLLVKGMGGLGNYKSLERYVDTVGDNVAEEQVALYLTELEKVNEEVAILIDGGLNDEVADQLSSAKSKIAALDMIRGTVQAFDLKLQSLVTRVSEKYLTLTASLTKVKKEQKTSEGRNAMATAINEFASVQESVDSLGEDLHKYCMLQVGYNSSLL